MSLFVATGYRRVCWPAPPSKVSGSGSGYRDLLRAEGQEPPLPGVYRAAIQGYWKENGIAIKGLLLGLFRDLRVLPRRMENQTEKTHNEIKLKLFCGFVGLLDFRVVPSSVYVGLYS